MGGGGGFRTLRQRTSWVIFRRASARSHCKSRAPDAHCIALWCVRPAHVSTVSRSFFKCMANNHLHYNSSYITLEREESLPQKQQVLCTLRIFSPSFSASTCCWHSAS